MRQIYNRQILYTFANAKALDAYMYNGVLSLGIPFDCLSVLFVIYVSRSSATVEGPRDALCQLKSCQLRAAV